MFGGELVLLMWFLFFFAFGPRLASHLPCGQAPEVDPPKDWDYRLCPVGYIIPSVCNWL